mmetsp:Transcript_13535/g.20335  ORF Transcript_13535/g.20335 Transcript_13535/m.20335 type:complete len:124 (+) Transcript_13535:2261-2632(+)
MENKKGNYLNVVFFQNKNQDSKWSRLLCREQCIVGFRSREEILHQFEVGERTGIDFGPRSTTKHTFIVADGQIDLLIGADLCNELGAVLNFYDGTVTLKRAQDIVLRTIKLKACYSHDHYIGC